MRESTWVRVVMGGAGLAFVVATAAFGGEVRLDDDFEGGVEGWRLEHAEGIRVVDSGEPAHGKVLEMRAEGDDVLALAKGSADWGPVRIEADFKFPVRGAAYLGLVYNLTRDGGRTDFGNLYVKGGRSYLRANPLRDGNVSRLLYEEYRTPLEGDDAVPVGTWHRLMAEVLGADCHVYVDDMTRPKLTFDLFERTSGMVGFKPRVAGDPVWIDNVRIASIEGPTWTGPRQPEIRYEPEALLTSWQVLGPLAAPTPQAGRDPGLDAVEVEGRRVAWRPFPTDRRGAVVTGRVTEYEGPRTVAYFRTVLTSDSEREGVLHVTTTDELALWVNGAFLGFVYRDGYVSGDNDWNAWYDFWKNPEHAGRRVPVQLRRGENRIVVRVRNGQFASGGFFARLEPQEP